MSLNVIIIVHENCAPLLSMLAECKQTGQAVQTAAMLQEIMLKKLNCGSSAPDVDTETNRQECLQLFAQLLRFLQAWRTISGNEIKRFQGFLVEIWGFGLDHFDSHNTKRPNVNLRAVFLLLDNFRSHPIRRSNHRGTFRLGFGELGAETKIGCVLLASRI